jgi:hypothetical protein
MLSNIAAFAAGILAIVFANGALSILTSGGGGYAGLLTLILIPGAIALAFLAIWLYGRTPTAGRRRVYAPSRAQRRALLCLAALPLALAAHGVVTGKVKGSRSSSVSRTTKPQAFWQQIGFYLSVSGVLAYLGLRKPTAGKPTDEKDAAWKKASDAARARAGTEPSKARDGHDGKEGRHAGE